jgi:hypothetical protein
MNGLLEPSVESPLAATILIEEARAVGRRRRRRRLAFVALAFAIIGTTAGIYGVGSRGGGGKAPGAGSGPAIAAPTLTAKVTGQFIAVYSVAGHHGVAGIVTFTDSKRVTRTTSSHADGTFAIDLPSGTYAVTAHSDHPQVYFDGGEQSCDAAASVTVMAGAPTPAPSLRCDF